MTIDKSTQKELDRMKNRTLDFDSVPQTTAPATDTDVKGVDNSHVYLSAGIYQLVVRVNGVPFRVAMTSAF